MRLSGAAPIGALELRVGDVVEVRSLEEIRDTLDERGEFESLPFMPEMVQFCGRRMTVHKVAHKLCDVIEYSGLRRMERAVHLAESRCDGAAHGGCQNGCQLYWKEAWLRKVDPASESEACVPTPAGPPADYPLLPLLHASTRKAPSPEGVERYSCQATEILRAAPTCLPIRDVRQFVWDVRTGNAGFWWTLRVALTGLFDRIQDASRRALPKWLLFRGGQRWGFLRGKLHGRTPTRDIGLQPGELVRVKSKQEILDTVNKNLCNRGLSFDPEMARFCGTVARVERRVDRCLNEKTGEMLVMKQPCIVLESVTCDGAFSMGCPRGYRPFWREIWLERVGQ